jgi:uncharacterized membrane protein
VSARVLLWTATAAYAAGFAALSVLRHRAFNTGRFDLGNMTQAVWSTAHGDVLAVTDLRGGQISRLAAHVDPVLVAFAPLWRVWPSPELLLTAQALLVALGAIPLFQLARRRLGSERAALGFSLAYLLYPAVQWFTLNEFHPVALACPLLLWAFRYLDEERVWAATPFLVLAALTKEEVGLVVGGIGVWYAFAHHRRRAGAVIAVAGAVWAIVAVEVIVPHFNEGAASAFYGRYDEVGGSPGGIVKTAFTEPWTLVRVALDERGLRYLLQLLAPLAFLSVLAPLALVAALPELALNLLSSTPTQTSIHFQYNAAIVPVLFAAAVFGVERLRRRTAVATGLVAVVLAANWWLGAIPLWQHVPGGESLQASYSDVREHDRIAARALEMIPDDAVVSVSNSLGGHVSARRRVLSLPYVRDATWIAADETSPGYADRIAPLPYAQRLAQLRRSPRWRLVFEEDGILVFRRRGPVESS